MNTKDRIKLIDEATAKARGLLDALNGHERTRDFYERMAWNAQVEAKKRAKAQRKGKRK